jgi:hypothetical protein
VSSVELWENLHLALAVCVHAVVTLSVHPPRVCVAGRKEREDDVIMCRYKICGRGELE